MSRRADDPHLVVERTRLMRHRLIARAMSRDPAVLEAARAANRAALAADGDDPIRREWSRILAMDPVSIRNAIVRRGEGMDRIRTNSPFSLPTDEALRRRMWRTCRRALLRNAGCAIEARP